MRQTYNVLTRNPFCSSNPSVNNIVKITLAVLVPHIAMLFITRSYHSLILIVCSIAAAQSAQIGSAFIKKTKDFFSWAVLLQALLIGMFVPAQYPAAVVFFTVLCILFLQKMIFGTFAQFWANTIIVAASVLYLLNPALFPAFLLPHEYFNYANVGSRLFSEGILQTVRFDAALTDFFNDVFHSWGISLPEGYISLLWDSGSPVPAFRFNVLTLVSSLVLVAYKGADAIVSYVFLFVYGMAVRLFSLYPYGGVLGGGDVLLAFCTGGTLFTAFFILGWFGTTPLTAAGKCVYGATGGLLMFFICGGGTSSSGVLFTVIILNILSPAMQYIEDVLYGIKLNKILIREGIKRGGQ